MATEIQEDCLGLTINPTLINPITGDPIDLTTATTITFRFLSPTAGTSVIEENGTVDGDPTLGKVLFSNDSDQFSVPGTWKYQVKIIFTGGIVFYSTISKIKVKANL